MLMQGNILWDNPQQSQKRYTQTMKTGYSLSLCISDILAGRVKESEVSKIIANTCARNADDWDEVLDCYLAVYWRSNPEEARNIFDRFLANDMIVQPRLEDVNYETPVDLCSGVRWVENSQ